MVDAENANSDLNLPPSAIPWLHAAQTTDSTNCILVRGGNNASLQQDGRALQDGVHIVLLPPSSPSYKLQKKRLHLSVPVPSIPPHNTSHHISIHLRVLRVLLTTWHWPSYLLYFLVLNRALLSVFLICFCFGILHCHPLLTSRQEIHIHPHDVHYDRIVTAPHHQGPRQQ